ncbi:MAG: DUF3857 domain-containing protein [Flavobacteriaceae bacterium]|nr:DUF3857 domain-containing protein [Flavobacteriaceae bacterium]
MTKFFTALSLIVFFFNAEMTAQNNEFGEVSEAEVASKSDPQFPEANAVVLYRDVNVYLGRYVEVHERIKIFNEEGYDYATIRIPYPDVGRVKGATYNLVDGAVVKTELDKDLIFTDEEVKGVKFKKFSFPNVSPGSVIELSYKSEKGTGSDIDLQYDIPIRKVKAKVTNNSQIGIEILQNPRAFLNVNRVENSKSTTFIATNVPALEYENYVYDMDLYRSYLTINVTAVTNSLTFGTWESLVEILSEVDGFQVGIKPKKFYKDEVAAAVGDEINELEKAKLVYKYVKSNFKWNENYDFVPDQSVRDTYKKKEGDLADINLVLISMLNSVGLKAHPILVSTKSNGIPLTASSSAFNAMIAGVTIGNKTHLFDAAHDESNVNFIASRFLNWQGLRMYPDKAFDWVSLTKPRTSPRSIMATAELDEDFLMVGSVKERHGGYYDINKKAKIKDLGENKIETIINYAQSGLEVSDVEADPEASSHTEIAFEFELDNAVDEIDDKLYFSPLLFFGLSENPFLKEERKYSIDFEFPFKDQTMLTIKIPENYKAEFVPEPARIALPEGAGSFIYRVSVTGQNIQVATIFEMKTPVLAYDKYESLREFFTIRMTKENEKIVLSKI